MRISAVFMELSLSTKFRHQKRQKAQTRLRVFVFCCFHTFSKRKKDIQIVCIWFFFLLKQNLVSSLWRNMWKNFVSYEKNFVRERDRERQTERVSETETERVNHHRERKRERERGGGGGEREREREKPNHHHHQNNKRSDEKLITDLIRLNVQPQSQTGPVQVNIHQSCNENQLWAEDPRLDLIWNVDSQCQCFSIWFEHPLATLSWRPYFWRVTDVSTVVGGPGSGGKAGHAPHESQRESAEGWVVVSLPEYVDKGLVPHWKKYYIILFILFLNFMFVRCVHS